MADRPGRQALTSMSLRQRLEAPDQYGLVLILILLSLIAVAAFGTSVLGRLTTFCLLAGGLLFAIRTSRAGARTMRVTSALVGLLVVLSVASELFGRALPVESSVAQIAVGVLVVATPLVIGRRLVAEPEVTLQKVLGALCIYLLLGMLFSFVFTATTWFGGGPFFAQKRAAGPVDYLYFSYTTLTTVGYGDLTARTGLGRMLAVTEALLGQLYMVTVVAVLVSRMRVSRPEGGGSG